MMISKVKKMVIRFGKNKYINKPKRELKTQIILPLFTHKIISRFLTVYMVTNSIIFANISL